MLADIATDDAIVATSRRARTSRHPRRPVRILRAAPVLLEVGQVGARTRAPQRRQPGYWERNGYHMYGEPFRTQRFFGATNRAPDTARFTWRYDRRSLGEDTMRAPRFLVGAQPSRRGSRTRSRRGLRGCGRCGAAPGGAECSQHAWAADTSPPTGTVVINGGAAATKQDGCARSPPPMM